MVYKKALAGEIEEFTGVDSPYEEPLAPEIVVETDLHDVEYGVSRILQRLVQEHIIREDVNDSPGFAQG